MKKKLILAIILIAFFIAAVGIQIYTDRRTTAENPLEPNSEAPDFFVLDQTGLNVVSLSDYRGKPVVLGFWATWNLSSTAELPDFQAAYDQYGDQVQFMLIDVNDGKHETHKLGQAYIEKEGYTFPIYFDSELVAALAYDTTTLPATYFIDRDGKIVSGFTGPVSMEDLEAGIAQLLSD